MTSPEHTLVGIHLALACGVHQRFGWRGVALAGIASNGPDWDGIPMLFDMQRFEIGHRVWGHNVLAILCLSILFAFTQYRFDWIGVLGKWTVHALRMRDSIDLIHESPRTSHTACGTLALTAFVVQGLHLPCDMVVSGGEGLSDWAIRPWWPISDAAYAVPLIPWGDVGPTVVLMLGIIVIAKKPKYARVSSLVTLFFLCTYLVVRGWSRGILHI